MATEGAAVSQSGNAASRVSSGRPSLDALIAGMPDLHAGPSSESTSAAAPSQDPSSSQTGVPPVEADAAAPIDKPAEDVEAKPDADTTKRLSVVAKAEAKFRQEQAAAKAEMEVQRAEIARMRAEAQGKGASIDELKALAKKNPLAALAKLGIESEDDIEVIAKVAYANSKTGKADPRNAQYAAQTAKERALEQELADLKKTTADLAEQFKTRDQRAQIEAFQKNYLDEAVKAIPAEPSLIGALHAKNPGKARQALLELGQRMEREADGETPSHAEVIAEYEKQRRAELEELGIPLDVALKKPALAAVAQPKKPAATLDPTATSGARPVDRSKMTEEQRRAEMLKEMPWRD